MRVVDYKSKVGWWVPAVVAFSYVGCVVGPMLEGDFVAGIVLGIAVVVIEIVMFAGVKYRIKVDQLGVRNFFCWTWYPIGKIAEVKKHHSILTAAALSFDRLAIRFTDRSILKSSMPLEISPKDVSGFIERLKEINPGIIDEVNKVTA